MKKFVIENKNFFFGMLVGVILVLIIILSFVNSNIFGNVADWVSGIGSIVAIFMIFWQVKKQRDYDIKNISINKEINFSSSRPLFTLNYSDSIQLQEGETVYQTLDQRRFYFLGDKRILGIDITNISVKPILALEVNVKYASNLSNSVFKVNQVKAGDRIVLGMGILNILDEENDSENEKILKLNEIETVVVYFTTEIREKIKLTFKMNNSNNVLEYVGKHIENRDGRIDNNTYGLNGFEESLKYTR
ncbi:hypothetical protein [Leuconostoc suionicum]|uniref:hypothetical protein n=1 Tax=Leuconostoc suionicum TaxID=1511761 RepID=UPI00233F6165|nr:hypothetical protein [Leuconostoc suionicum]MDC2804819.1 hypothetical protein [Leuconostoc suionicum]MDC2822331.1 hypothetical protein [Leuconostoc suionicum]